MKKYQLKHKFYNFLRNNENVECVIGNDRSTVIEYEKRFFWTRFHCLENKGLCYLTLIFDFVYKRNA